MAQRYGGKFSPDKAGRVPKTGAGQSGPGQPPFSGKRRTKAGGRINILFFAPIPLALRAFQQEPTGLAINLAAFGILMLAAWLTREGLIAEEAYDARRVAKRPAIPRKIFASVLTGAGLFVAGLTANDSLLSPVIFAILGTVLHSLAFGIDPLKDKGIEGIDSFQSDRVARAVDEAEKHLKAMTEAIARTNDRALVTRVEGFQRTARAMFRTVEEDPRDLTGARKYLGVYLLGAKDATVKFADLYGRTRDQKARTDYEALLDDLEKTFSARTEKMLLDDRSDLDVEIEVLRERLEREGVHTD
ncbi:5-bromo-4-chloroindolyl phosphate hydrolysis family protein [Palleronia sp. KMU-117]|uniref:5-bromo-4-chloroindolyl phosphate hydrolysis family protein n=1 Tax=Palleronia sp. KMU-117 TaxID=3434108 RepID=UPI003D726214